jgi:hypothetical protein
MAIKPQIIAATFVALIAANAQAQQFGPPSGNDYGPPAGMSPQMGYPQGQTAFVTPAANPMAYNGPTAVFGPTGMGAEQGGIQLVAAPSPNSTSGTAPPNMAGSGMAPNSGPMYMDPSGGAYPQGMPPGAENGMAYGPGNGMPPGYPPMQQPGMGQAPYGPFPPPEPTTPRWYFRGEVVWLSRNSPNERNLTSYDNASNAKDPLSNRFILDTDALPFGLAPGMRLTIGHYLTDRTAIEGAYYGINNWDQRTGTLAYPSAGGLGPLSSYWGSGGGPFNTSAFSDSNQQFATYHSSFESAELGIRQWITPSMSALIGLRYVNVADQFQLTATNDASNVDAGQVGYYRTWTNNNLIGLQIGTEYTHDLFTRWLYFSIEGKAGAYLNFADQKNLLFNTDTTYNQRSSYNTQFSSMFDLTFALTALVSDHLTLRGGYTFLFIDGVALATDQLDTNPTMNSSRNFLADNGTMTLQGPFVGAELAW